MASTPFTAAFLLATACVAALPSTARAQSADSTAHSPLPRWSVGALLTTGMDPRFTLEPGLEEQEQRELGPTLRVEFGRRLRGRWFLLGALEYGTQRHGGAYHLVPVPPDPFVWFAAPRYRCDLVGVEHATGALQLTGGYSFMPRDARKQPFLVLDARAGLSVLGVWSTYRAAGGQVVEEPGSGLFSMGSDDEKAMGQYALDRWVQLEQFASAQAVGLAMVLALRMELHVLNGISVVLDLGGQVGLAPPRFAEVRRDATDLTLPAYTLNPGTGFLAGGLCYRF